MRPKLDRDLDPDIFLDYYWLKEELAVFCKSHGLPGSGSKDDITKSINHYLKTEEILSPEKTSRVTDNDKTVLSRDSVISEGYKNDDRHRVFFKREIGVHFKFNVPFMNWMKENAGKTYSDAITEWNRIVEEKKRGKKTEISSQFQYNQYTRDFFSANPRSTRAEAIKCWKYKKSLPGHNRYEDSDLEALK